MAIRSESVIHTGGGTIRHRDDPRTEPGHRLVRVRVVERAHQRLALHPQPEQQQHEEPEPDGTADPRAPVDHHLGPVEVEHVDTEPVSAKRQEK